jgi:FG-GAP-like repeat/Abnormal spindle-like microcephaly-assoc'd, ASPM-SPD-2-Hydin/HYDIN/CFA65/VesB-like, Ig-like domain
LPFPTSIAVGDFNHDGNLDIAVASVQHTSQVSILLGNGDGTFKSPVNYECGPQPDSIAVADFNQDGKLDLVVTDSGSSENVGILLGNGDGTFRAPRFFSAPNPTDFVGVGDFNGDHKPDLVLINPPLISVMIGNGDGTFQAPINTTTSYYPSALGIGDFDRNGKLDLVVAEQFGGISQAEILLGRGDGTFQAGANYTVGSNPSSVAVADFRRTGKLDLAVGSLLGRLTVLLGNGDGTFQPPVSYSSSSPYWVATGDLNGDGKPDLAVAYFSYSQTPPTVVGVFTGNGDGTFQAPVTYPIGKESNFVVIGDFNTDKLPDLTVTDFVHNDVIVLLNTATVSFSPTTPLIYPFQLVGTSSTSHKVVLTNAGTTTLTISSMKVQGQFGMTSTCGASVAPGASCAIRVTFSPKTQGPKSGIVSIIDSVSSKPQVIELHGSGTVVRLTPPDLVFGSQTVGTTSPPQHVQVTNTGSAPLTLSEIYLTGVDYKEFSQSNNCNAIVAAGASCTITVTFTPKTVGKRSAFIGLIDTGGGTPQTVTLAGTGA